MDGILSLQALREIQRQLDQDRPSILPERPQSTFFGMDVISSSVFPYESACGVCNGTGEGVESTYCKSCSGAGRNRYEGMMRNGPQTILLTTALPKAFSPRFPSGLVPAPPMSRGLP